MHFRKGGRHRFADLTGRKSMKTCRRNGTWRRSADLFENWMEAVFRGAALPVGGLLDPQSGAPLPFTTIMDLQ